MILQYINEKSREHSSFYQSFHNIVIEIFSSSASMGHTAPRDIVMLVCILWERFMTGHKKRIYLHNIISILHQPWNQQASGSKIQNNHPSCNTVAIEKALPPRSVLVATSVIIQDKPSHIEYRAKSEMEGNTYIIIVMNIIIYFTKEWLHILYCK
jgi:hypothetical protein